MTTRELKRMLSLMRNYLFSIECDPKIATKKYLLKKVSVRQFADDVNRVLAEREEKRKA